MHASIRATRQIFTVVVSSERKEMLDMNIQLPADLEQFVTAKVKSDRFTFPDEAISEGLRLLRQQEEAEEAQTIKGI